jgi:DNA-binding NtrC family response regulator
MTATTAASSPTERRAASTEPGADTAAHPGPEPDLEAGAAAHVEPLDDVIRRHIEHALAVCHGRIDGPFGAAHKLVINPHTLRARMRKLGVDWRRHRKA